VGRSFAKALEAIDTENIATANSMISFFIVGFLPLSGFLAAGFAQDHLELEGNHGRSLGLALWLLPRDRNRLVFPKHEYWRVSASGT
jgi:hypothetical protein